MARFLQYGAGHNAALRVGFYRRLWRARLQVKPRQKAPPEILPGGDGRRELGPGPASREAAAEGRRLRLPAVSARAVSGSPMMGGLVISVSVVFVVSAWSLAQNTYVSYTNLLRAIPSRPRRG